MENPYNAVVIVQSAEAVIESFAIAWDVIDKKVS